MSVREFKFFHGITIQTEGIQGLIRTLRARWEPDLNIDNNIDAEAELTNVLSQQIVQEIDDEIIDRLRDMVNEDYGDELARRINGGFNNNVDYFNHWIRIGENNNRA